MNSIPLAARILIVVFVVIALAEFMPEAINGILILVLIGLILGRFQSFRGLFQVFNSFGG